MDPEDHRARLTRADPRLAGGRAAVGDAVDQRLDAGVEERLHHGPADEASGTDLEQVVRPGARPVDTPVCVEVEHPDRDQVVGRFRSRSVGCRAPGIGVRGSRS